MQDRSETSGIPGVVVPENAVQFALQKQTKDPASGALKWTSQKFQDPNEPAMKTARLQMDRRLFAEPGPMLESIRKLFGVGTYRFRWMLGEDGKVKQGGVSVSFDVQDPETAEPAPEAFGGRPSAGAFAAPGVMVDGKSVSAEMISPEMGRAIAMIQLLDTLGAGRREQEREASRQQFELLISLVNARSNAPVAPAAGGFDAKDLKIMMLEFQHENDRKIAALVKALKDDRDDDDDDEIDWDEPLGKILGREVKKGIVEVAEELTPEGVEVVKEALPMIMAGIKAKIAEVKAAKVAAAARANGATS